MNVLTFESEINDHTNITVRKTIVLGLKVVLSTISFVFLLVMIKAQITSRIINKTM